MKKNIYLSAIVFSLSVSMQAMEKTEVISGKDEDLGPVTIHEDSAKKLVSLIQAVQFGNLKIVEADDKGVSVQIASYFNKDQNYEYSLEEFNDTLQMTYQNITMCVFAGAPFNADKEITNYFHNFYLFMNNYDLFKEHSEFAEARAEIEKQKKWSEENNEPIDESAVKEAYDEINSLENKYKKYAKQCNTSIDVHIPQINKQLQANRLELKQSIMAQDAPRIKSALEKPLHFEQLIAKQ